MVMPGVGVEPGRPSRACDEAGFNCSRSLNESLSAGEVRGETVEKRRVEDTEEQCEVKRDEDR